MIMNKKLRTITAAGLMGIAAIASNQASGIQNQHRCENMSPDECRITFPSQETPYHMRASENDIANKEYQIQNEGDELAPSKTNLFDNWHADVRASDPRVIDTRYNTRQAMRFTSMPEIGHVLDAGYKCDIAVPLIYALMGQESNFRNDARGIRTNGDFSDAFGYMQLKGKAATEMNVDRFDDRENIIGGACYLARHINNFGDWRVGIAAYHDGQGTVRRLEREFGRGYENIKDHLSTHGRNHVCIVGGTLEKLLESQDNINLDSFRVKHQATRNDCQRYRI